MALLPGGNENTNKILKEKVVEKQTTVKEIIKDDEKKFDKLNNSIIQLSNEISSLKKSIFQLISVLKSLKNIKKTVNVVVQTKKYVEPFEQRKLPRKEIENYNATSKTKRLLFEKVNIKPQIENINKKIFVKPIVEPVVKPEITNFVGQITKELKTKKFTVDITPKLKNNVENQLNTLKLEPEKLINTNNLKKTKTLVEEIEEIISNYRSDVWLFNMHLTKSVRLVTDFFYRAQQTALIIAKEKNLVEGLREGVFKYKNAFYYAGEMILDTFNIYKKLLRKSRTETKEETGKIMSTIKLRFKDFLSNLIYVAKVGSRYFSTTFLGGIVVAIVSSINFVISSIKNVFWSFNIGGIQTQFIRVVSTWKNELWKFKLMLVKTFQDEDVRKAIKIIGDAFVVAIKLLFKIITPLAKVIVKIVAEVIILIAKMIEFGKLIQTNVVSVFEKLKNKLDIMLAVLTAIVNLTFPFFNLIKETLLIINKIIDGIKWLTKEIVAVKKSIESSFFNKITNFVVKVFGEKNEENNTKQQNKNIASTTNITQQTTIQPIININGSADKATIDYLTKQLESLLWTNVKY